MRKDTRQTAESWLGSCTRLNIHHKEAPGAPIRRGQVVIEPPEEGYENDLEKILCVWNRERIVIEIGLIAQWSLTQWSCFWWIHYRVSRVHHSWVNSSWVLCGANDFRRTSVNNGLCSLVCISAVLSALLVTCLVSEPYLSHTPEGSGCNRRIATRS